MEDLPESSISQSQVEEQATAPQAPEPEAVERPMIEPQATEVSASQSEQEVPPAPAEAPKTPAETAPAPARPTKPTGPRLAELQPGKVVEGKVTRIERYGAFVDLGLVEKRDGLIHISEMAPHRVRRVEDVVKVGDEVRARVVSVDLGRGRIALSLNDVDAADYSATTAAPANEPTMTAMAQAFERAYGRQREKETQRQSIGSRRGQGDKMRREQQLLMEKFRTSGR